MFCDALRGRLLLAACGLALSVQALAQAPNSGYRLESATVLPSTNTDWDYLAYDEARSYLFIARRGDGLTVFDTQARKSVADVPGSRGANGVLLVPEFDRIYIANTDGTLSTLTLSTLQTIERKRLDGDGLNGVFYEPTQRRVYAITGKRSKTSSYFALDAKTGALLGRTDFDSTKMDTPATDDAGTIYGSMRDRSLLLKLSAKDLKIEQTWPAGPCSEPVAMEYDKASRRLFVGCRGQSPVFIAVDPDSGKVVASVPIGAGVDGLVVDHENRLIITSNGADANFTVIRQNGPNDYQLVETISTRPMARVMAMDPKTRALFTVTADFTIPAAQPGKPAPAPRYHTDSFTVLTYTRK
jgi:DNA-binding beta-propeller fold protein YncE